MSVDISEKIHRKMIALVFQRGQQKTFVFPSKRYDRERLVKKQVNKIRNSA